MIDRKSVDINVVKNKTIPWMSCVFGIFFVSLYFQFRSARKESAEGHWGLAPSVLQLTL